MNDQLRDPLDQAIDRVAARLVSVEHDDAMVERIVAALPDRPPRSGWGFLVPQAAVGMCVALLAFAWINREGGQVTVQPGHVPQVAEAGSAGTEVPAFRTSPPDTLASIAKPIRAHATRPAPIVPAAGPDHERSLTPVAALIPLEVAALEAPTIPEEPPVVVAPLVLTELPLSGEAISPR